jgi:pimeloyl-ACP methyl ester carboxylesterase/class 3 adenylate cyclase
MAGDATRIVSELVREGDYWTVAFAGREVRVRDSKGMGYLAELLAHPGQEIPALALAGGHLADRASAAEAADAGLRVAADSDVGPLLDAEAKAAYRHRLSELEAERGEAARFRDPEREAAARAEYDAIARELAAATGRGGRDRRIGSPAERARLNVTRAVKKATARIARHDQTLGEHLTECVHTGRVCVYRSDPTAAITWSVSARQTGRRLARHFKPPETSYARSGEVSIAYQVLGDGPPDIVFSFGWLSHLDFMWTDPTFTTFLRRLASFGRVIVFDKRGTGLSDPVGAAPTLEERMDDIRAVMQAAGSERAALIGYSEGGTICALFAATYPERVSSLVLYDAWAAGPEVAIGMPGAERWKHAIDQVRTTIDHWGDGLTIDWIAPSLAGSALHRRAVGALERASMSPGMARALLEALVRGDIRPALPAITAPTLVIHHPNARIIPREQGRYLAAHIAGARYIEFPEPDHMPIGPETETIAQEIHKFLSTVQSHPKPERVLATILFAETRDAAGSSDATTGPYESLLSDVVAEHQGRRLHSERGLLAAFDGPARAIGCARQIAAQGRSVVRAGIHTGECGNAGPTLSGPPVEIGIHLAHMARPGEILVSQTVKDLVIGSGIGFVDRGAHTLVSAAGPWRLFAVAEQDASSTGQTRFEVLDSPVATTLADRAARTLARRAPAVPRSVTSALRQAGHPRQP